MAKDDLNKSLDELAKEIQKSQKGTDKILEKQGKTKEDRSKFFEALARSQKKHLEDTRNDAIKERKEKLQAALEAEGRGSVEAKAVAALQATKWKEESDKRLKNNAFFLGRMKNTFGDMVKGMKKTPEEKKEEADGKKGLLGALKKMATGDKEKGTSGVFGGLMKTIKKVFKVLQIKFLMIAGFVAFAIGSLKIKDLKKMWNSFTEAFMKFYEFMKPVVEYVGKWIQESVLPNLIDWFVDSFKSVGEMFGRIKEKFSGWSDMSLWEKVTAIFTSLADFGVTILALAGKLVAKVAAMFGFDGKWFTDLWASIKSIPNAFMDKMKGMKQAVADKFNEWMPDGIGTFLWEKVFEPFKEWFKTLFDFSTIRTTIESLINLTSILPNTIKKYLLDPAVKWIGDKFGFDTSKFTEFSIGELVMKGFDAAIEFLETTFDFKMPKFKMPDWDVVGSFKDLIRPLLEKASWIVPQDLLDWVRAKKKPAPPTVAETLEKTHPGKMTKDDFMQTEEYKSQLRGKDGALRGVSKTEKDKMYQAYLDGDAPEGAVHSPGASPRVSRIQQKRNKRLMHKKLAEQHRARKSGGIDWGFISDREGGSKLKGYVPDPEGSKSGVTIATGFDLGARGMDDLKGLSPELQAKLRPFLGFQGQSAQAALGQAGGLKITAAEAKEIDKMSKGGAVSKLKSEWNARAKKTGGRMFESLSSGQKTIAASVAFQYGSLSKAPKFRNAMQTGDWEGAAGELDNFGDSYGSRRTIEAAYLRNDSGNRLGSAHQESVRLASNANNGPPVMIHKAGDTTSNSNTQVIQPKDARNNKAFPAPKVSIGA
jgi:hypothetical protein